MGRQPVHHMVAAHRIAPVVADRQQRLLHGLGLGDQQLAQLPVAVLLDHEVDLVRGQERLDVGVEGEGPHAQVVRLDPPPGQLLHGLKHSPPAPADRHQPDVRPFAQPDLGCGQIPGRALDLPPDPRQHIRVRLRVLGVVAVTVVTRSARQEGALWVHARQRSPRDPVAVHIQVALEGAGCRLELFGGQHLAPVGPVGIVPFELRHDPIVHPDVQVGKDEDRRLEPLGQVERLDREVEALARVRGKDHDVLRVPVGRVGRELDVALLGPRGHPRRWAHPLHVEEDGRHLGVVRQPDEFAHQRQTRPAGGRERARPRPPGSDHHPRGGKFVLGLHDREAVSPGLGVLPELVAERGEGVNERGGRRDRVPGGHRRPRVDAAKRRGGVPVDHDRVPVAVHRLEVDGQRAVEVLHRVVVAEVDREVIRVEQLRLGREGLLQQFSHDLHVDLQQGRQGADVADVLHEDPHPRSLEVVDGHLREGDAQEGDVVAVQVARQRPARVVQDPAARRDLLDVALVGGRVHRDGQIEAGGPRGVAVGVGTDLVPGGQPLNVRREEVLPRHGNPHAEDRAAQQSVGAGRPRPVHRPDLEGEIVDPARRGDAVGAHGDVCH